jgi:integrase/recombinase XerD
MPTATAVLDTRYESKDGFPIAIRLIDGKKQRVVKTGYKIPEKYWQEGQVSSKHPDHDIINFVIDDQLVKAKRYFRDCKIEERPIDLDLVFAAEKSHSFTGYLRNRAKQHDEADEIEMYYKASRFAREITAFFGEVFFHQVTPEWVRHYDAHLKKVPNAPNTRIKKMEFLSKYFNDAKKDKKTFLDNPFKDYKITGTPVKKEKLTIKELQAIEELDLVDGPDRFARDIFLFSYYCKGIRFENVITMKYSDIKKDRLHFQTNKGKKFLSAQIHPKLKAIIDHYKNETDFIFGKIIPTDKAKKRSKIGSINTLVNRSLKTISQLAKIQPISVHISRHTLAQHLKEQDESIYLIMEVLGHSRTSTTETYLKGLDDHAADKSLDKLYKK